MSTFKTHLRDYRYAAPEAKAKLALEHPGEHDTPNDDADSVPQVATATPIIPPIIPSTYSHARQPVPHAKAHQIDLTLTETHEFHNDILNLFVVNNFPLLAISSPETEYFFSKWMPGAILPTCQALGGPILKKAVKKCEERTIASVKDKLAIGMSDGWKNIRKKSLLASMINVDYKVSLWKA